MSALLPVASLKLPPALITYALNAIHYTAPVAGECGRCKRMAIFFVNRNGTTVCAVCDAEARGSK